MTNEKMKGMSLEEYRERAGKVARALIKSLETIDDSLPGRGTLDLHLMAEGEGYAAVLIVAADLVAENRLQVSDETLTGLHQVVEESHDHELLEAYDLIM